MKWLREFVRKILHENYMSHTFEPKVGDRVMNTNPGCKHHGSEGVVMNIDDLPNGMGKVVTYVVTNNGPTFRVGKTLIKTMDQLSPWENCV
jgi:hypothetical protein